VTENEASAVARRPRKTEFCKPRPLVDLLEESGAQHALCQRIQLIFIGVDWRLSAARIDGAS